MKFQHTKFVAEGIWITGCMEPYKDQDSNYPLMLNSSKMFVTNSKSSATPGGDNIEAISFLNTVPCKAGLRHRMDFYLNVDATKTECLVVAHLLEHMVEVYKNLLNFDRYNFSLMLPEDYPQDMLRDVFECLGVHCLVEDVSYLIEGDIPLSSKL